MHDIYKLKEMLMEELKEYGQKGELTPGSLEVVDKLAHSVKNICKIIEAYEDEEGYSSRMGGSYRGGSYEGGSYEGGSYARGGRGGGGGRRGGSNQYGSYARGGGYSRAEDNMQSLLSEMRELMPMLSDEKRREAQRFVDKMQGM